MAPSGEKIDIIAEKSVIFGHNFQKNLPLVERSDLYERVQLVEFYQKILVTYLDGVSGGVSEILSVDILVPQSYPNENLYSLNQLH